MNTITFVIDGPPAGKGRPRFSRKSGTCYTPQKTLSYEYQVKAAYLAAAGNPQHSEGPVSATIKAYFAIPKSASKKKRQAMLDGLIPATKKPDCDNIAKIILDSLNGLAYRDDSQVYHLSMGKYYSESPRVFVELSA